AVPERPAANQKPPILAIISAYSRFDFPTLAVRHCTAAYRSHSFQVIRMKRPGLEAVGAEVVQGETEKLEQAFVRIERASIRPIDAHVLGKNVEEFAKLLLC